MHSEVNGIRVNYRVEGTGDRWITFVTGIANDLTMWDGQVEPLARDFRILRYDLRGHGGTQATKPPYTLGGPPPLMRALAEKVPGARHASVPGAAHIANIQDPVAFNQLLVAFLKEGI